MSAIGVPTPDDVTDATLLVRAPLLICSACGTIHRPYGEGGELVELGDCDPTDDGWVCRCGAVFSAGRVDDALADLAEDAALCRAGV